MHLIHCSRFKHSTTRFVFAFRYGAQAITNAGFGQGSGYILFNKLACVGNESSILSCPGSTVGQGNCQHNQDAGVICNKGMCL